MSTLAHVPFRAVALAAVCRKPPPSCSKDQAWVPFKRLRAYPADVLRPRTRGQTGFSSAIWRPITAMADTLQKVTVKGTLKSKEPDFPAYVGGQEGAPGLIVLQEWWGVDYEIKNHATFLVEQGFRVLIPDLYRGKLGLDQEEAHHLMSNLDFPNALEDIAAAAAYLNQTGSGKVGAVGFCMGGALSLAAAVRVPAVDAAVVFYGIPDPRLADPAQTKKPVQAHFGELDGFVGFADPKSAAALGEKLKASGAPYEVHLYPGQGHAFMNASEPAKERKNKMGLPPHDPETVKLAWSRAIDWFKKYL